MTLGQTSGIEEFLSPREGGNSWAQNQRLIAAWKSRDLTGVPPLTLEFAPILDCNADCPLCPYTRARRQERLALVRLGDFPAPNEHTVASSETARRVIDAAAEAGIRGTLWTGGGEPTVWAPLIDMLRYSARRGLLNCIYTNGFQLGIDPGFAERLLQPETGLVFVRVSVNAVSPKAVKLHWGVDLREVNHQFAGLRNLFKAREQLLPKYDALERNAPSIQISSIYDKNNIGDALQVCQTVAKIGAEFPSVRAREDVMIVRPLTIHNRDQYSCHDHREKIIDTLISVCGSAGAGAKAMTASGYRLLLGFGLDRIERGEAATYSTLIADEYTQRDCAWSNGCFLTVGPDGTAYLSTEHNCDSNWAIGDLKTQSVTEIYQSPRRRMILDYANSLRWGPEIAQPTARTNRLDRIARCIMTGRLTDSQIEEIRIISQKSHCLLLD